MPVKRLFGVLLLLFLLFTNTPVSHGSGIPSPTPPEPLKSQAPNDGDAPFNTAIVIHPDRSWEGRSNSIPVAGRSLQEMSKAALGNGAAELLAGAVLLELSGPVRRGETLVLNLPANHATGYLWSVESIDRNVLHLAGEAEVVQSAMGLGVPAMEAWRFQALDTAETKLRLTYRRPWETDAPLRWNISIQANGLSLAEVAARLEAPLPPPPVIPASVSSKSQEPSPLSPQALPTSYNYCDLGGCTPVKNQGNCGSCWAFATVGPLESKIKYLGGVTSDLAEQYLLSCNTDDYDCDGGWWVHDYHWNYAPPGESNAGAVLEAAFPYQADDTVPCNSPYNHAYRIDSWNFVDSEVGIPSPDLIKQAIYDHGPVAASICAGSAFDGYDSGIFTTNESSYCPSYNPVNHGIVLVGWDETGPTDYWILRNSWGSGWGESGYMRIAYGISRVGYSANYVDYTPFVATDFVYLPTILRSSSTSSSIVNGNFESGATGWTEYSQHGWDLILNSGLPVTPHSGSWAVWLGGEDSDISYIQQQVTVPPTQPYLNYWHYIASAESGCIYDYAYVKVNNTTVESYPLCGATETNGWVLHSVNLSAYSGQSVSLQLRVVTDSYVNSNLFIDDVSFQASQMVGQVQAISANSAQPKRLSLK